MSGHRTGPGLPMRRDAAPVVRLDARALWLRRAAKASQARTLDLERMTADPLSRFPKVVSTREGARIVRADELAPATAPKRRSKYSGALEPGPRDEMPPAPLEQVTPLRSAGMRASAGPAREPTETEVAVLNLRDGTWTIRARRPEDGTAEVVYSGGEQAAP